MTGVPIGHAINSDRVNGDVIAELETEGRLAVREGRALAEHGSLALVRFTNSREKGDPPLANRLRARAVGPPTFMAPDQPTSLLLELGVEALPGMIASQEQSERGELGMYPAGANYDAVEQEFQDAVLADSDLPRLFPHVGDDPTSTFGVVKYSSGTGGAIQLATLARSILHGAMHDLQGDDVAGFLAAVRERLRQARTLARDGRMEATTLMGCRGAEIGHDTVVTLPWGTLRAARPSDFTGPGLPLAEGLFAAASECVVELQNRVTARITASGAAGDDADLAAWTEEFESWREGVHAIRRKVGLAVALAAPAKRSTLVWTSQTTRLPFGSSFEYSRPAPPLHKRLGIDELRKDIEAWARRIHATYDPKIDLAVRRTIRGLSERPDPVDGFVDFVIAWESLFSPGDFGELTFRIAGSIAWLTEPDDAAKRESRFGDVKRLYHLRSRVLHGGAINSEDARAHYDDAAQITLSVFRALFLDRPDVIKSRNRAEALLIQGPPTEPHEDDR